jgi:outer membrane protein
MNMNRIALSAAAATACFIAPAGFAQETTSLDSGFVHFGLSRVTLADEGEIRSGGVVVPGAGISTTEGYAAHVEAGWFISDNIALALSVQAPFETDNNPAGSLTGLGNLGTDRFALASLGVQYHFNRTGVISPYVGAGLSYYHVLGIDDGVVQNLSIENAFGSVIQLGVDYALTPKWSLNLDIKKMYIETQATGVLGGAPTDSTAVLDPLVISAGFGFKF